jgi:hypothetical protein
MPIYKKYLGILHKAKRPLWKGLVKYGVSCHATWMNYIISVIHSSIVANELNIAKL